MVFLSVCCPVYNEEHKIIKTLYTLLYDLTDSDFEWELLLCLSGCTDNTEQVVRSNFGDDSRIIIILEETRTGKSSAVNLLYKNAKGSILLFVDSDIDWQRGSLIKLITPFYNEFDVAICAGRIMPDNLESKIIDQMSEISFRYWHQLRLKQDRENRLWSISGQIYAIRKDLFTEIPNAIVNEDAYVGSSVKHRGFRIKYVPDACVLIDYPRTWRQFLTQKIRTRVGWLQMQEETKSDVTGLYRELTQLMIDDLKHRNVSLRDALLIIYLLFINKLLFFAGSVNLRLKSRTELVKWKRI